MSVDRYKITLEYLKTCPALSGVFSFQGMDENGTAVQIITQAADAASVKTFIDGSKEKTFDFVVAFYRPVTAMPYVPGEGTGNASLGSLIDVNALIEWLDAQSRAGTLPNFGTGYDVSRIYSTNTEPVLAWIDGEHYNPPMAKYTVTVRVEYLDMTNAI